MTNEHSWNIPNVITFFVFVLVTGTLSFFFFLFFVFDNIMWSMVICNPTPSTVHGRPRRPMVFLHWGENRSFLNWKIQNFPWMRRRQMTVMTDWGGQERTWRCGQSERETKTKSLGAKTVMDNRVDDLKSRFRVPIPLYFPLFCRFSVNGLWFYWFYWCCWRRF